MKKLITVPHHKYYGTVVHEEDQLAEDLEALIPKGNMKYIIAEIVRALGINLNEECVMKNSYTEEDKLKATILTNGKCSTPEQREEAWDIVYGMKINHILHDKITCGRAGE